MTLAKIISRFWALVAVALVIAALAKSSAALFIPAVFAYILSRLVSGAIIRIESQSGQDD